MFLEGKGYKSLQVSQWPKFIPALVDEKAEKDGDLIVAIMAEVRHDKAEKKMPLNAPIKNMTVYAGNAETADIIKQGCIDIASTLKIQNIKVLREKNAQARQVAQYEVSIQTEY